MKINMLNRFIPHSFQIVSLSIILFITGSNPVLAYGGHHGGHYRHHGHGGGYSGLGYVFLGVAGLLVLSHYLNRSHYNQGVYQRQVYSPPPQRYQPQPRVYYAPAPSPAPVVRTVLPSYDENAGWDSLAAGDVEQALDIFAVQSLQDLDSGIPKVGFALAAASKGESARAARTMRKAVSTDPDALRDLRLNRQLENRVADLKRDYASGATTSINQTDRAFMLAALSYLDRDYITASQAIAASDNSESSALLQQMIRQEITVTN